MRFNDSLRAATHTSSQGKRRYAQNSCDNFDGRQTCAGKLFCVDSGCGVAASLRFGSRVLELNSHAADGYLNIHCFCACAFGEGWRLGGADVVHGAQQIYDNKNINHVCQIEHGREMGGDCVCVSGSIEQLGLIRECALTHPNTLEHICPYIFDLTRCGRMEVNAQYTRASVTYDACTAEASS